VGGGGGWGGGGGGGGGVGGGGGGGGWGGYHFVQGIRKTNSQTKKAIGKIPRILSIRIGGPVKLRASANA